MSMTSASASMVVASVVVVVVVLLQLAPSTSASKSQFDSIFNPFTVWPNPDKIYEDCVYYGPSPKPDLYPFSEFGKDMDLTYFTKDEYEAYGEKYWEPKERAAYHNANDSYPFDYVVEKWLNHGQRLTRFLNYTNPKLATEKFTYYVFFTMLGVADQEHVFRLVQERLYRNFKFPCEIHVTKIDFDQSLDREVMRHVMYGYDWTQTERPKQSEQEVNGIQHAAALFSMVQIASDMHNYRLSERDRRRICRYNQRPTITASHQAAGVHTSSDVSGMRKIC